MPQTSTPSAHPPLQPLKPQETPVDTQKLPKWLPISILAATTAALAVPLIYLRRQRANNNALLSSLQNAPRRRGGSGTALARAQLSSAPISPTPMPRQASAKTVPTSSIEETAGDNFNAAIYTAKAFGIATLMVGVGAVTTVWGAKTWLGVQDTQEFAHRMRRILLTRMPGLSKRIHRLVTPDSDLSSPTSTSESTLDSSVSDVEGWNWPDAEVRLKEAFEKEGFTGWAQAALKEVEAEGRLERARRMEIKDEKFPGEGGERVRTECNS